METIQDFLSSIYKEYQVFAFRGGRVVRGKLRAMTDDHLARLKDHLRNLGWLHRFEDVDNIDYLNCTVLDTPLAQRRLLHLGLFVATIFTTLLAGGDFAFGYSYAILSGIIRNLMLAAYSFVSSDLQTPRYWLGLAGKGMLEILGMMKQGIPFSAAILTILGCHEMGHYLMARRHGMNVTLPFFIPVPLGIGTLGAVIRIKSPLVHRRAVLDVGAAGPLTGMVVSVIFLTIGLYLSKVVPNAHLRSEFIFGDSLFTKAMIRLIHGTLPARADVVLHPFAFAGWLGMLITAINLMPIGQLDGGHVAYALFGRFQRRLATMAFGLLVTLGLIGVLGALNASGVFSPSLPMANAAFWPWLLCAAFMRSFMKPAHPPTLDETVGLNPARKIVGFLCIILLILCFVPTPVIVSQGIGAV